MAHSPAKLRRWLRIFEQHQQSGLSQKKFCKQQNLNLSTFQYWKKRAKAIQPSLQLIPVVAKSESLGPVSLEIDRRFLLHFSPEVSQDALIHFLTALMRETQC